MSNYLSAGLGLLAGLGLGVGALLLFGCGATAVKGKPFNPAAPTTTTARPAAKPPSASASPSASATPSASASPSASAGAAPRPESSAPAASAPKPSPAAKAAPTAPPKTADQLKALSTAERQELQNDPSVRGALNLFGGEVVDMRKDVVPKKEDENGPGQA